MRANVRRVGRWIHLKPLDDAEWLREFMASADRPGQQPLGSDCLGDLTLAGLVDGTLDPETRPVAVAHVSECSRCRTAAASLVRAMSNPSVAREIGPIARAG